MLNNETIVRYLIVLLIEKSIYLEFVEFLIY